MTLYKNAFYWFIGLLAILVLGFWQSYFSQLGAEGEGLHWAHHFHGMSMLAWVLLLITQSWLIRNKQNTRHRTIGKVSFVLAPLIVISGLMVTFYSQGHAQDPLAPFTLSIFWFGVFDMIIFPLCYGLAIFYRKNMQLHARYMVCTGLVFIVPGLSRSIFQYFPALGIPVPSFFQVISIPMLIAAWLFFLDWRKGKLLKPYAVFVAFWALNMWIWTACPEWEWWQEFGTYIARTWA